MKIGIDATSLSPQRTGIGNYVYNLLESLIEQHPEADFYLYGYNDLTFSKNLKNVRFFKFPLRLKGPFFNNLVLPFYIRLHSIDVFWGASGFLPLWRLKSYKSIVTVYDHVYRQFGYTMSFFGYWSRRLFQPLSIKLADRAVAISEFVANEIKGKSLNDIGIVCPAISDEFYNKDNFLVHPSLMKEPYLLVLGTIEPRKNIHTLIKAYKELIDQNIKLPKLVIVGKLGWRSTDLITEIKTLEQVEQVIQLGFVSNEQLPRLYRDCYCFLMPSLYEGFGMPLVEAQLCGAPVAASTLPVFREATDNIAIFFEPTTEGLKSFLRDISSEVCPLVCRRRELISNSPDILARSFWAEIERIKTN